MSAISDFAGRVKAHNAKIDGHVDAITADVGRLNAKIAELQASQGTVTPEDQGFLDELESMGAALATKIEVLDAATEEPVTPPVDPPVDPIPEPDPTVEGRRRR